MILGQMILRNILGHTLVIIQMWLQLLIIYPVVEQFKSISLENENIKVNYGAKESGALTEEMIETYWFDEKDTMKKNFFFNAIYLVILVPNAKIYEFQVENKNFKITREEMLSILHRIFDDFPKEKIYGIKIKL